MEPGTSPELRSSYKEHIEKSKLQHTTSKLPINVDYTLSIVLANEIAFLLSSIIHQMKDLSYKVKYQCIECWVYKNTSL